MTSPWDAGDLAGVLTALAALLGAAGWLTRLGLRGAELRKLQADGDKTIAEAGALQAGAAASLLGAAGALIDDLRERLERVEQRCREIEIRERKCCEELQAARREITMLRGATA